MEVRDTRLRSNLLKNIYLSHDFKNNFTLRGTKKPLEHTLNLTCEAQFVILKNK